MEFGKRLSELRRKNEISQEKLAELVGVSRQAVTKWESGKSNPDTENLIRLAEIFEVSVDELYGKETPKKPEPKIHAAGHILAALSVLTVIAYCVIGALTEKFSGEMLILLLILAFPMHAFLHLVFWGMIKSGEFTMLAGYDPNIKYNTDELKRYLAGLDFMLGFETVSYIFLLAVTSLMVPEFQIYEILIFGYIISFAAGIFFMGYKYGDKIYLDPKDAETAKRSAPSSVIMLAMILVSVGFFVLLFELKGYQNNTIEPFPMLGLMFLSIIAALIGYLLEQRRIKKADEHAPLFGKPFVVLNAAAVIVLVLMAFI
ncbi:MAG: helix-turn-helix transcriptional regulator [Oscillospiraceae bacterium]|nr:helix-turn-helix transcriptional regulator [Oscillospiraceae bacterium]